MILVLHTDDSLAGILEQIAKPPSASCDMK